jgi:hypothetical protein
MSLGGVLWEDNATDVDNNNGCRRQCWRVHRGCFKCSRVDGKRWEVFKAEPWKEKKR